MKVVHFCTYSSGGAAIAAIRLHTLLCESGIDSSIVFLYKNNLSVKNSIDFRDALSFTKKISAKIQNKLLNRLQQNKIKSRGEAPELFSFPQSAWDISSHPLVKTADVIHFHWMANFLDYRSFSLKGFANKKICWTLHDLNPFSGGFHYEDWFNNEPWTALSKSNQKYKYDYVTAANITLIAPSEWIMRASQNSFVFKSKPHVHIPNPSSDSFFYTEKEAARKQLGIKASGKICFLPGDNINYLRKGMIELEALLMNQKTDITFLTTGQRPMNLGANEQHFTGIVSNEQKMALCYSASDLMVFPSLDENYSNTLVESLLCGCPAVCFDIGGNKEIVKDHSFGKIISYKNWEAIISVINEDAFTEEQRRNLAQKAASEFASAPLMDKMIALYRDL
ncbi:MAG: glycosyl transferase group 1 [Bacteroidetes bacterium]|nr:glycosyl transferase group 1 [Bacteroidota bacterium]